MTMLFIIASVAAAVAIAATTAASQSTRDRSVKRAIAAADAGVDAATYRTNKIRAGAGECVVNAPDGQLVVEPVQADGWCRPQTEQLGDGAVSTYRIRAAQQVRVNNQHLLQRKVVSTGLVNGVRRRVTTTVGSATGLSVFSGYAVISLTDLTLPNSTFIKGNAATNGNIHLANMAELCGNGTFGIGKQLTTENTGHQCAGYTNGPAEEPFILNPIDQGDVATVNDNARLGVQDAMTDSGRVIWDATKRSLVLQGNSTLTLTGDVYSFCYLEIANNAQLIVAARDPSRPPLKIYVDAPENCDPSLRDRGSVELHNGAAIANLNPDPVTFQLFVVGSTSRLTRVDFLNNFDTNVHMVIYAPESVVTMQNHNTIVGAVAAKTVYLQNNSDITWHRRVDDVTVDNLLPLYQRQVWQECAPLARGATPDSTC